MCDVCEEAAEAVAGTTGGALDAEDVRRIVRAFNETSDAILERRGAQAYAGQDAPPLIESVGPEDRVDEDEFLGALVEGGLVSVVTPVLLGARPFVLIEAVEARDDGLATCSMMAGGGLSQRDALSLLRSGLEAAEQAGTTPDA